MNVIRITKNKNSDKSVGEQDGQKKFICYTYNNILYDSMIESKKYLFVYDLPLDKSSLRVKVNRALHKINAKKLQHSIWQSDDVEALKEIVDMVKRGGGQANVLEKKIIV